MSLFRKLSEVGKVLIDTHLLRNVPMETASSVENKGDSVMTKGGYSEAKVWINRAQCFTVVQAAAIEIHASSRPDLRKS